MIAGQVQFREPAITVSVLGDDGRFIGKGVIDTGFSGYLALPKHVVDSLDLAFHVDLEGTLADGSVVMVKSYRANVEWDGATRTIVAIATEGGLLVGMAMMDGYDLNVEVTEGGTVTLTRR